MSARYRRDPDLLGKARKGIDGPKLPVVIEAGRGFKKGRQVRATFALKLCLSGEQHDEDKQGYSGRDASNSELAPAVERSEIFVTLQFLLEFPRSRNEEHRNRYEDYLQPHALWPVRYAIDA